MTRYEPGDVVLLRFPFTDLASVKRRPAVVVNPPKFTARCGDIVVVALTSQDQGPEGLLLSQWSLAGLPKPTWVKPLIATVSGALVDRRLGTISAADVGCLRAAILLAIESCFR